MHLRTSASKSLSATVPPPPKSSASVVAWRPVRDVENGGDVVAAHRVEDDLGLAGPLQPHM